jgi:hypothetical protein
MGIPSFLNPARLALVSTLFFLSFGVLQPVHADTSPGGFLESDDTSVARPNLTASQIAGFMPSRGVFTFPAPYNTQGIRVTNANDCGGGDCVDLIYSYWRNMSNSASSNTLYIFVGLDQNRGGAGPTLFSYDKTSQQVTNLGPMFAASSPYAAQSGEGWYFSYSKPTTLYITVGSQLQRYDVLAKTFQTVFDTTTKYPGTSLWQTSTSNDDDVHVGALEDSSYNATGCVAYKESTQQFFYFPALGSFDECNIDKSGRYVLIDEKTPQTCSRCDEDTVIEDLQTGTQTILLNGQGGGGHYAMGYGGWIQADNWTVPNAWRWWDGSQSLLENGPLSGLGSLIQGGLVHQDNDWNVFEPSHISWENASASTPVNQQYACGGANPTTVVAPHSQEITCFLVDDSVASANEQVLVVAPTMTDPNASGGSWCSGCVNYAQDPKGNIDPTGQYFFYVSNLGGSRMDAIIVKIPSQVLTGSSNGAPTPPTVAITSPTSGSTVSNTITVSANATDGVGIAGVQFQLDGVNLDANIAQAPYSTSWNTTAVAAGSHTLTAIATDTSGLSATSSPVTVTTQGNTVPPVISVIAATATTSSGATIGWTTDQLSSSEVVYGLTTAYGSSTSLNTNLVMAHSVTLTGLAAGTTYHYEVESWNASGTLGISGDMTFTTVSSGGGGMPNPIGYWKFDAGSGTTAMDTSGNGYTGTLVNGPVWTTGVLGDALAFNGTSSYVNVPSAKALDAYPLTVATWFKTGTGTGLTGLVNKYVAASMNGYQIFMNNGNLCAWYFRDSGDYVWDGSGCTLSTAGFADNNWHYAVFVVDANGGRLYVDGSETASQAWTGNAGAINNSHALSFGRYPGVAQPYFSGLLDDVRLYNAALTAQQVTTLYASFPSVKPVLWTNVVNLTVSGSSLQKTGGCDGCEDATANSIQRITANGYLQFTATETNSLRAAGLTNVNAGIGVMNMNYAIRLQSGDAEVREDGVYMTDVPFVSGDVFKIAVVSGVVNYYKNGVLIYASKIAPSYPLQASASISSLGGTIANAMISTK